MKQNKNYSAVIRVASATLSAFVLFFSLCIPSFAYTDSSTNGVSFDNANVPIYTNGINQDAYNISLKVASGIGVFVYSGTNDNVYAFWFKNGNTYTLGISSNDSIFVRKITSNLNSSVATDTSPNDDGMYNVSFNDIYVSDDYANVLPKFDSVSDGISAVKDWINNPPSVAPPAHVAEFTLPAGNAVVIDLGAWDNSASDKRIQFSQTTKYAHPQNWSTNQFYAYTSEIPSSISTPFTGQNPINWVGYGKTNLFNQTYSFNYNLIYQPFLGRYLVIINPFVPEDHDTDNYNSPISVYVSQCSGYKFYQLKTDVSQLGAFGGEGDGTTGTGTFDPDTGTWSVTNDQTGEIWSPTQGGGNSNNAVFTISGWLEQISHQIGDFFTGAVGAVSTLVNAGSAFINQLIGLYSWLPAPVYSVLSAALILVITIGVIKVFV